MAPTQSHRIALLAVPAGAGKVVAVPKRFTVPGVTLNGNPLSFEATICLADCGDCPFGARCQFEDTVAVYDSELNEMVALPFLSTRA